MNPIPTLTTDRLCLRPFTLGDASDVQRLAGDYAIADTTLAVPHPYEDGMAETWIATHEEEYAGGKGVTFAITRKADGDLVGAISLLSMTPGHQAELGYWVGVPFWGRGYCTEAGSAVVGFAFTELELLRVHACHLTRNPASGRVLQKLGMQHEGTRRQHVRKGDRSEDLELYGVVGSA